MWLPILACGALTQDEGNCAPTAPFGQQAELAMTSSLCRSAWLGSAGLLLTALAACGGGGSDSGTQTAPASPVVVSASPAPPAGIATNPYAGFSFSASGGSPPFTWAITSGALPAGLTLASDGTLSGTPTSVGAFAFTVRATDSAQAPGTGSQRPFWPRARARTLSHTTSGRCPTVRRCSGGTIRTRSRLQRT